MNKIETFCKDYTHTIQLIAFLVAIAGLFFMFDNYINNQIEDKITNAEYMSKLSRTLRPYMVFNEKGVTTYNHGAKAYISEIKVDLIKEVITVKSKEYLQFAPLIMFIGSWQYSYVTSRIDDKTWSYKLQSKGAIDTGGKEENLSYVLEVLS